MKKIITTICLLFCFNFSYSQDKPFVHNNLFKINILNPGFTFEKGVNNNNTVCIETNLSIGFHASGTNSSSENVNTTILISPFLRGQYRHYYNFEKRIRKGKNISLNSGNYLAFSSSYYFDTLGTNDFISIYDGLTLGGVWGFQKTYRNNLNIGANLGLGYNISRDQSNGLLLVIDFTIGWVIGK